MKEHWWISAEVRGGLESRAPLDVARWMHVAEEGTCLSSDRQSVAAKLEGDPPLLVKWRRPREGRRLRTILRPSRERREARAYIELAVRGVRTPLPWAVGERRHHGMLVGSVLIRRFRLGFRESRDVPASLAPLGATLRQWHDLGFRHGDCYPKNVLVPDDGTEAMPIGCPAARFTRRGGRLDRARRKDLAQWAAGAREVDPDDDPFRFLESYAATPGLPDVARLRTWIRPAYERILGRKKVRRSTQAVRERDGPLRPTPLPIDGAHPPPVRESEMR